MPINFPTYSAGQVPIPRQPQPIQLPPFKDPSDIILAAAHLRQQDEAMQQKKVEDLSNTIMAAAGLFEKQRESKATEAHAQALLDLQQQMQGPKMKEIEAGIGKMQAETSKAQSEADLNNMFTQIGAVHPKQTYGPNEKVDVGYPPEGVNPAMWGIMARVHNGQDSYMNLKSNRGPAGSAALIAQNLHSMYFPYDDMNKINAGAKGEISKAQATAQLEGGQIEKAVRSEQFIQGTLSNMKTIIPRLTTGQLSLFNKIQLGVQQDTGDRDVNLLNGLATDAMKELPQLFPGNTGSDFQAQQSLHMLNQAKSPGQLMDSVNQLQMTAHDRSRAWQKLPISGELIRQAGNNKNAAKQALSDAGYNFQ